MALGSCSICYSSLTRDDVFAPSCGHTFHEQCLLNWLKQCATPASRTCPKCRCKITPGDVRKLFFDSIQIDSRSACNAEACIEQRELVSSLNAAFVRVTMEKRVLDDQLESYKKELDHAKQNLQTMENKYKNKLLLKDQQVRHLCNVAEDVKISRDKIKSLEQQLECSAFFQHLIRENSTAAIKEYINDRGDPDGAKFMELLTKNLEHEKRKGRERVKAIAELQTQVATLEACKNKLQECVRQMRDEIASHGTENVINPQILDAISCVSPRRESLCMPQPIDPQVVISAFRRKTERSATSAAPSTSSSSCSVTPVTTKLRKPLSLDTIIAQHTTKTKAQEHAQNAPAAVAKPPHATLAKKAGIRHVGRPTSSRCLILNSNQNTTERRIRRLCNSLKGTMNQPIFLD